MHGDSIKARDLLATQYELVKGSREVVFQFCEQFNPADYTKAVEGFGRGSICTTQIHIANTYTFWAANSVMEKSLPYNKYEPNEIKTVRKMFETVNSFMEEFIREYADIVYQSRVINIPDSKNKIEVSFLQVFTHVITHEFHHKGQVMSMGRLLGYTPPDADVIRFS